ncbi:GTPase [Actinacidiphila acididurans]|uniref:GTPase n=1 Tax=Actinacidiphila acididurans TaxID=2784346 RepID=UPI0027DDE4F4|nr:GTPase [Actinacidiphila acididurans]
MTASPSSPAGTADGTRGSAAEPSADPLSVRADALGELLGLSRTRIGADDLAEGGELLARMGERRRLSSSHTVVALAGATGSGKSTLFNALTGRALSETGVRRPTTARPVACSWQPEPAAALLDRLGIAPRDRHVRYGAPDVPEGGPDFALSSVGDAREDGGGLAGVEDQSLDGLVLLDLPDHDSAAAGHREQVDRLLRLVDVVVWVVDPEKYADHVLHERYLRAMAGHADVTVLVLNQADRLPGEAADLVLDDLRRLLDEDGLAVGEHGDSGAVVLAASALTGQGVPEVRAALARIVGQRAAVGRRLVADLDRAASGLRPLYVGEGGAGLTEPAREEFIDRLADAVGASAIGQSAERDWAGAAWDVCGTPWGRLMGQRTVTDSCSPMRSVIEVSPVRRTRGRSGRNAPGRLPAQAGGPSASRAAVDEAVRGLVADASRGLPAPWARAVGETARRGAEELPAALDEAASQARPAPPDRPGWWAVARAVQWALVVLALAGGICLLVTAAGLLGLAWWSSLAMITVGGLGGPLTTWTCRTAARGPARRHGQAAERRLRDAAAGCGRALVLEPVAAELMRYREVREHYAVVAGVVPGPYRSGSTKLSGSDSHSHE